MSKPDKTTYADALRAKAADLFSWKNRGLLLDITVFLVNVFLMWLLTPLFLLMLRRSSEEDPLAMAALCIVLFAAFFLPPAAAILKRQRFHQRRKKRQEDSDIITDTPLGCLANPIFYFCLQVVIISVINAIIVPYISGTEDDDSGIFLVSLFTLLALAIVNTVFVYRYFTPPQREPRTAFLLSRNAELLGDACIFANMLFYQLIWNLMTAADIFPPVSGLYDLLGRLFFLSFAAFLIYFPPRIFYLAEDAHKPRTWLTMFVANTPVIFRVMFGMDTGPFF